jgi:hypothetical protein
MTFPSIVNWPVAKMDIDIVEALSPEGFPVFKGEATKSERTRSGIARLKS